MKKFTKIDKNYIIILIFCLIVLYLIVPEGYIFGSRVDWFSQHIVFPDYFRKLFYNTGNLVPNFAMSIGAGQNIYNFSYYGLLNPFIIFSYLLPFVSMTNYIMILNCLLFIFFGFMEYYFLKTKFSKTTAIVTTIITLCASPVLFHFHRHFMFVDYLGFLLLGFIGVDKFFSKGDRVLLVISSLIMILMSYYYSVVGIFVLCLYALYCYVKLNKKIVVKDMIKKAISFLIPILIAILIASILLIPTLYVLLDGRSGSTDSNLLSLLIPKFNIKAILYDNYSMGLTAIAVLGLALGFSSKKRENKLLAILLTVIITLPIFIYILNGGLYVRNKILIPFIPLFSIIIGEVLEKVLDKKISLKRIGITILTIIALTIIFSYNEETYINIVFYIDILILFLIIYFYYKAYTNKKMLISVVLFIPLITLFISNYMDTYVENKLFNKKNDLTVSKEMKDVLNGEKDIVRFNNLDNTLYNVNEVFLTEYNQNSLYSSVSNSLYQDFYRDTFNNALSYRNKLILSQNNDILFQMFMGVKYIYSEGAIPIGYKKISNHIYENENSLPLFYGSSSLTNEKLFKKLSYPYNIGTLLNSSVVDSETTKKVTNGIERIDLDYNINYSKGVSFSQEDDRLILHAKDKAKLKIDLGDKLKKDILILEIELDRAPSCKKGDLGIDINGINNTLTCRNAVYKNKNRKFNYVISDYRGLKTLNVLFKPGKYVIKNIKTYALSYDDIKNSRNNLSYFKIKNKKDIYNGRIEGSIDMLNNGYFISSIPYDKGFNAYVDGKKIKTEIVNTAFLGFKLDKGKHSIKIVYRSLGFRLGVIFSIIGLILFMGMIINERKLKSK